MFGIGVVEMLILLGLVLLGLASLVVLFFVVRAAVRPGNRDSVD